MWPGAAARMRRASGRSERRVFNERRRERRSSCPWRAATRACLWASSRSDVSCRRYLQASAAARTSRRAVTRAVSVLAVSLAGEQEFRVVRRRELFAAIGSVSCRRERRQELRIRRRRKLFAAIVKGKVFLAGEQDLCVVRQRELFAAIMFLAGEQELCVVRRQELFAAIVEGRKDQELCVVRRQELFAAIFEERKEKCEKEETFARCLLFLLSQCTYVRNVRTYAFRLRTHVP